MRASHHDKNYANGPTDPPCSVTIDPHNAGRSALVPIMIGVGAFAFVYLVLLARAVSLDERANQLDRQIAHARSQRILAEQQLRSALTPDALGIDMANPPPTGEAEAVVHVPTPPLPELEPCPVLMVADAGAIGAIEAPEDTASAEGPAVIASAEPPG